MSAAGRTRRTRKPKPSFKERVTRRVGTAVGLGRTLVNEPRRFPVEVSKLAKSWFRALWEARGGGLYACGFIVTFVWLELRTLIGEVMGASGVGSFIVSQAIQAVFRFSLQSLENTVIAFTWPVLVLLELGGYGVVVLVVLFVTFPRYIKPHLTRWLLDHDTAAEAASVAEEIPASANEPSAEE